MNDESLHDILQGIGRIEGSIQGINERLDRQNGRLDKHDESITELKLVDAKVEGIREGANRKGMITGATSGSAAAALVGLLAWLFDFLQTKQ